MGFILGILLLIVVLTVDFLTMFSLNTLFHANINPFDIWNHFSMMWLMFLFGVYALPSKS